MMGESTAAQKHKENQMRSWLCYSGDETDALLNGVALLLVVLSFILRSMLMQESALEERLFWLAFAALAAAVQFLLAELTSAEGISLVWCALLGLSAQAHLSFAMQQPSASLLSAVEIAGTAAAAAFGLSLLVYYMCMAGVLSTAAHLVALGGGFGTGLGAHRWALVALLATAAAAAAVFAAALSLCWRRRVREVQAARARMTRRASEDDLALAQLQFQLMRTRDEAARLLPQLREQHAPAAPREMDHSTGAGPGPPTPLLAPPADADELRAALERLRLREQQLCERLEVRRSQARGPSFPAHSWDGRPLLPHAQHQISPAPRAMSQLEWASAGSSGSASGGISGSTLNAFGSGVAVDTALVC